MACDDVEPARLIERFDHPSPGRQSVAISSARRARLTRRRLLVMIGSSTVAGLLAACSSTAPSPTAPVQQTAPAVATGPASPQPGQAAPSPAAAAANKLVIANTIDDIITFDPGVHYEITSQQILGAVYEGLVAQYPPDLTKFQPVLAKEVPTKENGGISSDGKVYTFKLRENVKFHSGNPLTADDVVFSMRRLHYLQKNPSFLADPFSTKETVNVEAVDPMTVRFTLTEPNVAFLSYLATTNTVILDSKTVKANGGTDAPDADKTDKAKDYLDQHSAGTGPYKLTSFKLKEEVIIERNPTYWRQPAAFDQIVLKYIKDSGTSLQQLQAGAIDIAQNLDADAIASLKGNNNFAVVSGNSLNHFYLALNTDQSVGGILADKRVRQAIGYAIDYNGFINGLLKGAAIQPATIIPIGLLSADRAQPLAYKTDVDKAKSLIKEAGVTGKSVKFAYAAGTSYSGISSDTIAAKLKADIERCGITIELVPMEPQQRLADYRAAKLQLTMSSWSPDYVDVHTYAEPFAMTGGAAAKRVKYSNPRVDELLKRGLVESDQQKRSDIYLEIQKILIDEAPFLVIWQDVFQVGMKKNITNYVIHPVFLVDLYGIKRSA